MGGHGPLFPSTSVVHRDFTCGLKKAFYLFHCLGTLFFIDYVGDPGVVYPRGHDVKLAAKNTLPHPAMISKMLNLSGHTSERTERMVVVIPVLV